MGESLPNRHEDHIAGKGNSSLQHHNLVHKFIPMPKAMKIPAAKAAVDNEWEKIGEHFGVKPDESQKQERGDRRSKDEGCKSSFCITDGLDLGGQSQVEAIVATKYHSGEDEGHDVRDLGRRRYGSRRNETNKEQRGRCECVET